MRKATREERRDGSRMRDIVCSWISSWIGAGGRSGLFLLGTICSLDCLFVVLVRNADAVVTVE